MAVERTLSIIKPDAVAKNVIGQIYSRFEGAGLKVVAARMTQLSRAEAEGFYAVHRERPFFADLTTFINAKRVPNGNGRQNLDGLLFNYDVPSEGKDASQIFVRV